MAVGSGCALCCAAEVPVFGVLVEIEHILRDSLLASHWTSNLTWTSLPRTFKCLGELRDIL